MNEIDKFYVIKRKDLSEVSYFTSLVSAGNKEGIFSDKEVKEIQLRTLELLKHRIGIYTGVDSSSVSDEIAESIMKSNLYTLGVFLKKFSVEDGINNIRNMPFGYMYDEGLKMIYRKIRVAKSLYFKVVKSKVSTQNEIYNATIDGGLTGFFKIYNPEFEADKIKITADYPLYNNLIGKFSGIEFIEKYIQALCYENEICSIFDSEKIETLLYRYSSEYKELVINICQIVLTECIGCILVDKDFRKLSIERDEVYEICKIFNNKSKDEMMGLISLAWDRIKPLFESERILEYIERGFSEIEFYIYNAVKLNKLNKIFV